MHSPLALFDDVVDSVGVDARDVLSFSTGVSCTTFSLSRLDLPLDTGVVLSFSVSAAAAAKKVSYNWIQHSIGIAYIDLMATHYLYMYDKTFFIQTLLSHIYSQKKYVMLKYLNF